MTTIIKTAATETQTDPVLRVKDAGSVSFSQQTIDVSSPGFFENIKSAVILDQPNTDVSIVSTGKLRGFDTISVEKLSYSLEIRNSGEIIGQDIFRSRGEPGSEFYWSAATPTFAIDVSFVGGLRQAGLIRNDGTIASFDGFNDAGDSIEGVAISIKGAEITIVNTDRISGDIVVEGQGADRLLTTDNSRISGDIYFEDAPVFIKHGGDTDRIITSEKADKLVVKSTGSVELLASMKGAADIVFNRGSLGLVDLGNGDDLYKAAGRGSARSLEAGEGNDTLRGAKANDTLAGEGGDDVIIGGKGDDLLRPGDGADRLLFQPSDGNDTVEGFSTEEGDTLFLKAHGFESLAELQAQISIVDRNTFIDLGNDSILLVGFRQELEADDVVL
ncbi:MAG: hypothetical protein ROR55_12715 [Devosia sp.]